ncbi:hypothetical protein CEXT_454111 [Caerostris extrusa]|uniref:Secreted protein n=1 Tax=Caerostris extrusa TaxID=172846 RepID=A0AAV4P6F6_CAEEX|nr:hypothetical protein CEXT_454111 [Caerostris extrusa]
MSICTVLGLPWLRLFFVTGGCDSEFSQNMPTLRNEKQKLFRLVITRSATFKSTCAVMESYAKWQMMSSVYRLNNFWGSAEVPPSPELVTSNYLRICFNSGK